MTSVDEIFSLAGVDHLTIAPGLLTQLAQPYVENVQSLFDIPPALPIPAKEASFTKDQETTRLPSLGIRVVRASEN